MSDTINNTETAVMSPTADPDFQTYLLSLIARGPSEEANALANLTEFRPEWLCPPTKHECRFVAHVASFRADNPGKVLGADLLRDWQNQEKDHLFTDLVDQLPLAGEPYPHGIFAEKQKAIAAKQVADRLLAIAREEVAIAHGVSRLTDPRDKHRTLSGYADSQFYHMRETALLPQPGGGKAPRSGSELLAQPIVPIAYLVAPWLVAEGASIVLGKPHVGKTVFSRNLMVAVEMGLPFLGHPTKRGHCLYYVMEGGPEGFKADLHALGMTSDFAYFLPQIFPPRHGQAGPYRGADLGDRDARTHAG